MARQFKYIDQKNRTHEMNLVAVKQNDMVIRYIGHEYTHLQIMCIGSNE